MDAKNDDSAGSDSLDKSLQKKCVVDDVGQGEGSTANAALAQGISERNDKQKSDTEAESRPAISINSQKKTEKSAGDGLCGSVVENSCRIDGKYVGADIAIETKRSLLVDGHEETTIACVNNNAVDGNTCTTSNEDTAISNNIVNDITEAPSESNSNSSNNSTNSSSNCSSNNSYAFETKVKQISKNLKETTLAECANKKASTDDANSTSSTSSASSASSTPECEQATVDAATAALYSLGPSTSAAAAAAAAIAAGASAQDEHDHRSKKVRFHPDVKENDGGNKVIPKKKKKLKIPQAGSCTSSNTGGAGGSEEASGSSQRSTLSEDDMELDEEEDVEEEATFSIAKTIEDALDYLKEHPLTFAGSFDKSNITTQSGLLEEENLPQLSETSEDDEEDFFGPDISENGVSCILGKQNKCGKVEFLLRYIDRPGLFWETEEFIGQRCPNLLNQYEQCRERRQARLMNFVAKRQNLRQRYTDF